MILIAVTGGIGSGKSSVAACFAERGATVIDADEVAREVVAPGSPGLAAIRDRYGDAVVVDGSLNRAALGSIVFSDDGERRWLESVTHPLIRRRTAELLGEFASASVVVHEVPLLAETGVWFDYDAVVVVTADEDVRVARLVNQRGMGDGDARARIAAQASDAERLRVADHVVDNSGGREALDRAVDRVWRHVVSPGQ